MLLKKTAVAFIALFMLTACNTTKKPKDVSMLSDESPLAADFERHAGDRVFFSFDKSDLTTESKSHLHKQAEWLKKHSHVKATIEGHCDQRGTREYNLGLGERRADAVRKYLINQGIESNRLDTISYGKEKPAVEGNDEAAWAKNRRAVTSVK